MILAAIQIDIATILLLLFYAFPDDYVICACLMTGMRINLTLCEMYPFEYQNGGGFYTVATDIRTNIQVFVLCFSAYQYKVIVLHVATIATEQLTGFN